jgi:hypothetical protein
MACAVIIGVMGLSIPGAATTQKITVTFFGDSLVNRSSVFVHPDFNRSTTTVQVHATAGSALCDWLASIDRLTPATAPTVAVIEFIGNHRTPCISHSRNFIAQYGVDLTEAIRHLLAIGVKGVVVDRGPITDNPLWNWLPRLLKEYQAVIASFHSPAVAYDYWADLSVEGPHGRFSWTKTCLKVERDHGLCPASGREVVRSSDGVHFCPVALYRNQCPVYASGSYRFVRALATMVGVFEPSTRPG